MGNANTVEIDGVGPVLFERSKRAKHVIISVKPFTGVRVAIPDGLSFKKAEGFVYARTDLNTVSTHPLNLFLVLLVPLSQS